MELVRKESDLDVEIDLGRPESVVRPKGFDLTLDQIEPLDYGNIPEHLRSERYAFKVWAYLKKKLEVFRGDIEPEMVMVIQRFINSIERRGNNYYYLVSHFFRAAQGVRRRLENTLNAIENEESDNATDRADSCPIGEAGEMELSPRNVEGLSRELRMILMALFEQAQIDQNWRYYEGTRGVEDLVYELGKNMRLREEFEVLIEFLKLK